MNQGRIWCVVNPTVGLPLFLGSVAVTSLIVHYSVLSNTTWFSHYWQGGAKAKTAAVEETTRAVAANTANGFVITVSPVAGTAPKADSSFVITVSPEATTVGKAEAASPPEQLALAGTNAK